MIPGSHKWDDERLPRDDEAVYAEMEPGSALIFLSSTRHAGGANRIQDPRDPLARRVMFSYFFAKGYLRQEENMLVSIPREVVLRMDPEMQALIGYEASGKFGRTIEKDAVSRVEEPLLIILFEQAPIAASWTSKVP